MSPRCRPAASAAPPRANAREQDAGRAAGRPAVVRHGAQRGVERTNVALGRRHRDLAEREGTRAARHRRRKRGHDRGDLSGARGVDLVGRVGWLVIVAVRAREEVHDGNACGVERHLVAGTEATALDGRAVDAAGGAGRDQQVLPLVGGRHAEHGDVVVTQTAHHVEVEHRAHVLHVEARGRRPREARRAQHARLFAREGREDDVGGQRACAARELARRLEHARRARGVVVGAHVRQVAVGRERVLIAEAEVIVVRANDDGGRGRSVGGLRAAQSGHDVEGRLGREGDGDLELGGDRLLLLERLDERREGGALDEDDG